MCGPAFLRRDGTRKRKRMARVLYLRGLNSRVGGPRVQTLRSVGHQLLEPLSLPYPDLKTWRGPRTLRELLALIQDLARIRTFAASGAFAESVAIAQNLYDRWQP